MKRISVYSVYSVALLIALSVAFAQPAAQATAKRAMTVDDYTKWRSISGQEISGDGKWVTYVLQLTNVAPTETRPVLHLLNLQTNEDVSVPNATGGTFSSDSKWMAYTVDPSGGRGGRGRGGRGGAPVPDAQTPAPNAPAPDAPAPNAPASNAAQPSAQNATQAPGQGRGGNQPPTPPQQVELPCRPAQSVVAGHSVVRVLPAATHLMRNGGRANAGAAGGGRGAPRQTAARQRPARRLLAARARRRGQEE